MGGQGSGGWHLRISNVEAIMDMLKAEMRPLEPYPGNTKTPWRATHNKCGKEISPVLEIIRRGDQGCYICGKRRPVSEKITATMAAADLQPLEKYPGAGIPWRCIHTPCGKEVTPRYNSIVSGQGGCVHCAGRGVDLEKIMAVMAAADLQPLEPYKSSVSPWSCIHTICGREVTPAYGSILQGQGGCKFCSGHVTDPKTREEALERAQMTPLEPYPGHSKLPWRMIHTTCNNESAPRWNNLQQAVKKGKSPCIHCARNCPKNCGCSVRRGTA